LCAATRDLSNVRLSQAAVGERSGKTKLYISDKLNVDHRAHKADGDSRRVVPTEMVALDDYFKPGQCVDLIKLGIQGYELHALRGAKRVLQENADINLLLEFWPSGLEQAGVQYGPDARKILWFDPIRCARCSKRYLLVRQGTSTFSQAGGAD
jgi:hypothetical protein